MTIPKLTDQQVTVFNTFGYLVFKGLLKDRIQQIDAGFEALFDARGGGHNGAKHNGTQRSAIAQFVDSSETLSTLLDDPRILSICTTLLGDDFNYMGSDGNYYVGDTGWHSDGWYTGFTHIKIALYLDPITRDTGALRVIPGSHRKGEGFAEDVQKVHDCTNLWSMHGRDVPSVALDSMPGDVVVFNHNLKHASFGGSSSRRMFTLNCCQHYPDARLQELRDNISGAARFWVDRLYGDAVMRTATPARMKHLEQVMANDGHLAELSRKARATMKEPARG